MSLNVGDLVASIKLDKAGFTAGLATSKAEFEGFSKDLNTQIRGVAPAVSWLGQFIRSQAEGSGTGILSLTHKFMLMGVAAAAGSLVAGGALAGIPLIAAGVAGKLLASNAQIDASYTALGKHIKTQLTADVQSLVPVAQQTAKQLGSAFTAVNPQIKSIFQALGPQIGSLVSGLVGLVSGMMPGITAIVQSSGGVVKALASGLGALGQGLGGFFTALTDGAQGAAQGLGSLLQGLGGILPILGQVIGALAQAGGPIIAALMPVLKQLVSVLANALIPLFQFLGPVIASLLPALSPVVAAFGRLLQAAMPMIESLGTQLVGVLVKLAPMLVQILDAIGPLIPSVVSLMGPFTDLVPVFAQIITALVTGLAPILVDLVPVIGQIVAAFEDLVAAGLTSLLKAVVPLLPQLGKLALIIAQSLLKALTDVGPAFMKILQALPPILKPLGSLLDLVGQLKPILPLVVEGFLAFKAISVLVNVFNIVKSGFSALSAVLAMNPFVLIAIAVAAIALLIITHWTQIKAFLAAVWDGIKAVATTVWNSITGFFGDVVHAIGNVLGGLGRIGAHLWDWLGQGLKGAVNGVLHLVNFMIDRLNDLLGGLSSLWTWTGMKGIPHIGHIPYLAAGGLTTAGGLARVGEKGAETVALPKGAAVFPHGSEPAGSGNGGGTVFQVMPGGTGLDRLFVTWLKKAVREQGGNPVVFGP